MMAFEGHDLEWIFCDDGRYLWDKATTSRFATWFESNSRASRARLESLLGIKIRASVECLQEVDSWLCANISQEPYSVPDSHTTEIVIKGQVFKFEAPPRTLTDLGWSIVFDVGNLFADITRMTCPQLQWRSVFSRGTKIKDIDHGLPALFGFPKKVHLQPQHIVRGALVKYLEGEKAGVLPRLMIVWSKACISEAAP